MTQFDYSKFSDKKLHQLYTTFSLMGDSKQHQGKPAVGVVKEGLLQELKRRGLKNEADENKCNAGDRFSWGEYSGNSQVGTYSAKDGSKWAVKLVGGISYECRDMKVFGESSEAALARAIEKKLKPKSNSKENAMDKVTAMKKKILLSNASDAVKVKALKKVMENAGEKPSRGEFEALAKALAKKLTMQKESAPLATQQKASNEFNQKLSAFESKYGKIGDSDMGVLERYADKIVKSGLMAGAGKDF